MSTNAVASLNSAEDPGYSETVFLVNISEHGARFIGRRRWPAGKRIVLEDSTVNFQATAEVVYCAPYSPWRFAVGVKFISCTDSRETLRMRCPETLPGSI